MRQWHWIEFSYNTFTKKHDRPISKKDRAVGRANTQPFRVRTRIVVLMLSYGESKLTPS